MTTFQVLENTLQVPSKDTFPIQIMYAVAAVCTEGGRGWDGPSRDELGEVFKPKIQKRVFPKVADAKQL